AVALLLSCDCVFSCFFFFNSSRRHTSFKLDWSSDVSSPDLPRRAEWYRARARYHSARRGAGPRDAGGAATRGRPLRSRRWCGPQIGRAAWRARVGWMRGEGGVGWWEVEGCVDRVLEISEMSS